MRKLWSIMKKLSLPKTSINCIWHSWNHFRVWLGLIGPVLSIKLFFEFELNSVFCFWVRAYASHTRLQLCISLQLLDLTKTYDIVQHKFFLATLN